jgi:hypothetical protein
VAEGYGLIYRLPCVKTVLGILMALLLAGCQQLPLTPEDVQARKFEAVPDKAVIYLVRDYPDFSEMQATVHLGDKLTLKTYAGTYYRWEVAPGEHQIRGAAFDTGAIRVHTLPGRIYFVQQRVTAAPFLRASSFFSVVNEPAGRAAVVRSVLLTPDQSFF